MALTNFPSDSGGKDGEEGSIIEMLSPPQELVGEGGGLGLGAGLLEGGGLGWGVGVGFFIVFFGGVFSGDFGLVTTTSLSAYILRILPQCICTLSVLTVLRRDRTSV